MFSEFLQTVVKWFEQHPWVVWAAMGLSLMTVLAALVVVPWLIVRIPADYFAHNRPPETRWGKMHPALHLFRWTAKNLVGAILVVAGFIMLFVPGPGVITMLIGLGLMDLPGKRAAERWIVARPPVFASLNKLRAKYNHPPLEHPQGD